MLRHAALIILMKLWKLHVELRFSKYITYDINYKIITTQWIKRSKCEFIRKLFIRKISIWDL